MSVETAVAMDVSRDSPDRLEEVERAGLIACARCESADERPVMLRGWKSVRQIMHCPKGPEVASRGNSREC